MVQEEIRVSVLLSTLNRCDKLRLFLDGMKANGSFGPTQIEVLVIDNNSSDGTKQLVEQYTGSENPVFRYRLESRPGKSRAINAALSEARGDIIAFTDDDCIPSSGWVESIVKEFDSDPRLSVLGGRIELFDPKDVHHAILLGDHRLLVTDGWNIVARPAIIGANMAFRKTALTAIHGFDPLLGPGMKCRAAEDLDLIYRSLKMKFEIAYSPEVIVRHNHGRRTEQDENQTSFSYAIGRGAFYAKHLLRCDFHVVMIAFKELFDLVRTLTSGAVTRKKFPYHRVTLSGIFQGAIYYCQEKFTRKQFQN